ncbi:hypothetical protein OH77DRAFT_213974 [Trametes cingulata]|nr:hypothetical protein OH77DRAFT_213974 [Trametes cingulata]
MIGRLECSSVSSLLLSYCLCTSPTAVLRSHLFVDPAAPSSLCPDVPCCVSLSLLLAPPPCLMPPLDRNSLSAALSFSPLLFCDLTLAHALRTHRYLHAAHTHTPLSELIVPPSSLPPSSPVPSPPQFIVHSSLPFPSNLPTPRPSQRQQPYALPFTIRFRAAASFRRKLLL